MNYKVDLHTHSYGSSDGGLKLSDYQALLTTNKLDYIAITDHDRIDIAQEINASLGHKIIVGQEITTREGEIIGLFLSSAIAPKLSARETALAIKDQGALVYIPHPFETVRKGITRSTLDGIADLVDIVEVHNGRAVFQNKGPEATVWARLHNKVGAASSDAHGIRGVGTSYTTITDVPSARSLAKLLEKGHLDVKHPPILSLLYPKYHRLRDKLKKNH